MKTSKMKSIFLVIILVCIFSTDVLGFEDIVEIESAPGTVLFSHSIHKSVKCDSCHHSDKLNTIIFACRKCHQKSTGKILHAKEAFHKTCIGCHLRDKKNNKKTGPAKLCGDCHIRRGNPE